MSPSGVSCSGLRSKRRLPCRYYGSLKGYRGAVDLRDIGVGLGDTLAGGVGVSLVVELESLLSIGSLFLGLGR